MDTELFETPAPSSGPGRTPGVETAAEHVVRGEVLRVVYASDDGQYLVVRVVDESFREHTLVGALGGLVEGQDIEAWGHWETHREHGRQLRVTRFRAILPTSEFGIRRYLASGLIPGIGPKLAERIVEHFGTQTLEVLDKYSSRLREVPGLGRKRLTQIREAWQAQAQERDVHIFLQGVGLGPSYCARIVGQYGAGAAEVVRQNPYVLAREVQGIGFLTADRVASHLGVGKTNPLRLAAGAVYVLDQLAEHGHTCFPRSQLLAEASRVLGVDEAQAREGLDRALLEGGVVADTDTTSAAAEPYVYHRPLYAAETELATALQRLLTCACRQQGDWRLRESDARYQMLNQAQRQALRAALTSPLSIITGGPGVGKTTVVGQVVAHARGFNWRVLLAAPTGRAAKRLSESSEIEAKTIHRLLKWDPARHTFVYGRDRPLPCDLLIVDEVSMLDVVLANQLFRAVRPGTRVVLVGDRDQLPSVGPGFFLHDLISSRRVPVTHLTEIYRQKEDSRIVWNAHAVNRGVMPDLAPPHPQGPGLGDFYWIDQEDPERVLQIIARMVSERIPRSFGYNPLTDVQVLAPMHRGTCGAIALNELLQRTLNGGARSQLRVGERTFRAGDRVMQCQNNYDKGVFNGELGQVVAADPAARTLAVAYDVGVVEYEAHEVEQVRLAYAVTVHKSQGSEFPVVIMPLLTQHYIMLQRNLVYTGMTRARRLLVMVGTRKALAIAIRNDKPMLRHSLLSARLRAADAASALRA